MTLLRNPPSRSATRQPPPRVGMVWIPGGSFLMGSNDHYPEEAPERRERVEGFWIDEKPVTNRDFALFVKQTNWKTTAEIAPDPKQYPGAPRDKLVPASLVFTPTEGPVNLENCQQWWTLTPGAAWNRPYGAASSIDLLDDHPVVHVAWRDVAAYAEWAGLDLPTEAQWEYAARGGSTSEFAWGDELMPDGRHMANIWQGRFPYENKAEDGWMRTSPVGFYPPNEFGLYDMIGNVWEWTKDWWSTSKTPGGCCEGAAEAKWASIDLRDVALMPRKVLKGGSHLCAPNYCRRYRPPARHPHPIDTSTSHVGFRCVAPGAAAR